ncbi:MAG TPA: hypothetical protein VHW64_05925 [Nocardioides sp.]|jgi:hypothetical protein|uniref:hypothetical protein n=1 Tax=Nocardioides sp. TaxID=35761 RepID=UPI002E3402F9|nr:hypothetical protein [Nocardioides sp.]HEX3930221.1 hypothetical protein [Nocardioides sp.]
MTVVANVEKHQSARTGPKPDRGAAAREREARSASGVSDLLARRPELRGVLPTADWLEEATLWSA